MATKLAPPRGRERGMGGGQRRVSDMRDRRGKLAPKHMAMRGVGGKTKRRPRIRYGASDVQLYPDLPAIGRALFPAASYDRDRYMEALDSLFSLVGVAGVALILVGAAIVLALAAQGSLLLAIPVAALTWLVWFSANVARDVLEARYRAVLLEEDGQAAFARYMSREGAGTMLYLGHGRD